MIDEEPEKSSEEEVSAAINISEIIKMPAPWTNRFYVTNFGTHFRLTFFETVPGIPEFPRSAVSMSITDARQLKDTLSSIFENIDKMGEKNDSD